MEWRIIVPVLCLIGILHVRGNAAQSSSTTSIISTAATASQTATTNPTATASQTATTNPTVTASQTATTNPTATASKTATTNPTVTASQTATTNPTVTASQTATTNPTVTASQTATTNPTVTASQTATTNPTVTASQTATTNPTVTASQTATTNLTVTASQTATTNPTATVLQSTTPATAVSTPAATTPTPANTASLNLVFKLIKTFKPIYSDLNNPETKQLADEITKACTPIYQKKFTNFLRMFIRKFSEGSVVTDSVLEFNNTNNASPDLTEVKNTFVDAIAAGNFTFTVDNTSISVSDITANVSATTTVSTTAGFNLSDYNVTFKMNANFNSELSNIGSPQAVALAKNITDQFDGVFKKRFTNFVRSLIWRFRSGSIIVDALLGFDKTGTNPTAAEVFKIIVDSAKNGTFTFTVDSLIVTDPTGVTANRSPVLASMMTALWMTLASLVVSAAMH